MIIPWFKVKDFDLCIKRLKSLQRRLLRPREFLGEYDEIIREQLQNGIIEQITENNNPSLDGDSIQYLPHDAACR